MGKQTIKKLYFRFFLLFILTTILIVDYLFHTTILQTIKAFRFLNFFSMYHLFWLFIFTEMLIVFIPRFNQYSYSGKHLFKHYQKTHYNKSELSAYTLRNRKKAINSAIFWLLINLPFIILYFLGYLHATFFYWLFFVYYFCDTVCINIFCVFNLFIIHNKCCNDCRIYNWGHIMYCTPLLFIPSLGNYLLVGLSVLILIQWELAVYKHPERFSPISNKTLQCPHCTHQCRYNHQKKRLTHNSNVV